MSWRRYSEQPWVFSQVSTHPCHELFGQSVVSLPNVGQSAGRVLQQVHCDETGLYRPIFSCHGNTYMRPARYCLTSW